MSDSDQRGDHVTGTITGNVSGQAAIGKGINQRSTAGAPAGAPTEAELADFRRLLEELRAQVAAEAPPEVRAAAAERVGEMEAAVTAGGEPDLDTLAYVRKWFARNLPSLAGAVTSVVIHPLVGRLVTAGGDAAVAEFRRRFGG